MLIYSTTKLLPANVNMIVLADKSGAYYYVHRSLFEQAVIIEDRYKENTEALEKALGVEADAPAPACVTRFLEEVPRPLNMLGYFLYLVNDTEELDPDNMTELCGAIHVMSSVLNFREFLRIPREARAGVSFSLSVREEYELSWDRFFQEAIPYSALSSYTPSSVITQPVIQQSTTSESTESGVTLETAETEEDFLALLDEDFDIDLSSPDEEEESEEMEAPEPEPAPEPKPVVKSGLSLLGGM